MKVGALMTRPAVTIREDTSISMLVDMLVDHDMGELPVVDAAGHLMGVITEADLMSREAYGNRHHRRFGILGSHMHSRESRCVHKAEGRTAAELMTTRPVTASPDDDITDVARRMLETHHKRFPVVDAAGRVVGIVSRHDVLQPLQRPDADIAADIDSLLRDTRRAPERHEARAAVFGGLVVLYGATRSPGDGVILERQVGGIPGVATVESHLVARELDALTAPAIW